MNTQHRNTTETPVEGHAPSLLPAGRKFRLAWADEFDGDALDESVWSYRVNFWGRPAHWFAHPEDKTVDVRDGCLHLRVAKRPDGQFVSPQLQTGQIVWDYPDNGNTKKFWWIDFTDHYLDSIRRAGTKVFFRLGQTIEQGPKKYGVLPPKDFAKWARICEHVIRHYNEGWGWGLDNEYTTVNVAWSNQFNIVYWEIWNEPDLDATDGDPRKNIRTWGGTVTDYFQLYETAAKHLPTSTSQRNTRCVASIRRGFLADRGEATTSRDRVQGRFRCRRDSKLRISRARRD